MSGEARMSRLFGWSYPPSCSGPPDYPDPCDESLEIQGILEDNTNLSQDIIDRIIYIVDDLAIKAASCPECERRREDAMYEEYMRELEADNGRR
jgi:hypothetical protein